MCRSQCACSSAGTRRAAGTRGARPRGPRGPECICSPDSRSPARSSPHEHRDRADGSPSMRIVDPDGPGVGDDDVGPLRDDGKRELLRLMIRCRRLDRECMALQRQGELTVYPPFEGQEAAQVGSAFALGPDDFVFPSFRELAAAVVRGVDVVEYLQYHRGTWHGGPYDPIARTVRADLRAGGDADRPRGRVGARREARRDRRVLARVLRRRVGLRGRLPRGREHGRGVRRARDPVLPEQRVGDLGPGLRAVRRRRSRPARPATASPASGSTATTCSRCTRRRGTRSSAPAAARVRR